MNEKPTTSSSKLGVFLANGVAILLMTLIFGSLAAVVFKILVWMFLWAMR